MRSETEAGDSYSLLGQPVKQKNTKGSETNSWTAEHKTIITNWISQLKKCHGKLRERKDEKSPSIDNYGHYSSLITVNISGHNAFHSPPAMTRISFTPASSLSGNQCSWQVLPADDDNTVWSRWTPAAHPDAANISSGETTVFYRISTELYFFFVPSCQREKMCFWPWLKSPKQCHQFICCGK